MQVLFSDNNEWECVNSQCHTSLCCHAESHITEEQHTPGLMVRTLMVLECSGILPVLYVSKCHCEAVIFRGKKTKKEIYIHTADIEHSLDPERDAKSGVEELAANHFSVIRPPDLQPQGGPCHVQPSVHVGEGIHEDGLLGLEDTAQVPGYLWGGDSAIGQTLNIQRPARHAHHLTTHIIGHPDLGMGRGIEDGQVDGLTLQGVPEIQAPQVGCGRHRAGPGPAVKLGAHFLIKFCIKICMYS